MIDDSIKNYIQANMDYRFLLGFCFGRPYEKIMENEQYQKDSLIRPAVIEKLKAAKEQIDRLAKFI